MEKSKKKCSEPPVDCFARLLWEHRDWLVGVSVGATIVGLTWIIVHMSMVHVH